MRRAPGRGRHAPARARSQLKSAARRAPTELLAAGNRPLHAPCDRIGVERVDFERDTVRELVVGPSGRGDDGRGAGHRLEHRQPESLVERDVGDARGATVEPGELLVVHAVEAPDALAVDGNVAPALGADEAQLEAVEPRPAKALDEPRAGSSVARAWRPRARSRRPPVARRARTAARLRTGSRGSSRRARRATGAPRRRRTAIRRRSRLRRGRRGGARARCTLRVQRLKVCGCRRTATSWIETTSGTRAAERCAHARAVEHVDSVAPRCPRERHRIPDRVARDPSQPAGSTERVAADLERRVLFDPFQEVGQVAGGSRFRQGERRDVETHAEHGVKCLRELW